MGIGMASYNRLAHPLDPPPSGEGRGGEGKRGEYVVSGGVGEGRIVK